MSRIYLSTGCGSKEAIALSALRATPPAILISFPFLDNFQAVRSRLAYREWVLDSGAYTAWRSGQPIALSRFMAAVHEVLAGPDPPAEVFSLDVIGDAGQSLSNARAMRDAGLETVPTWHYGEPEAHLLGLAEEFPKIAIGGMAGTFSHITPTRKFKLVEQVFARVWPKRIHGFGVGGPDILMRFPFDSVDASNWSTGPQKFGQWASYGQWKRKVSVPSSAINLACEVDFYLALEARSEKQFARELASIRTPAGVPSGR